MSEPVKLYVYDLSNGLARQMSLQLTGRQIDGIWHTSIVVYGKEIFYGQGINITAPGRSHHGQPLQIVDLGSTDIDEGTLNEYLDEMKEHYTADKYHLLEFNCNSFTNDCAAFLTGGSIPDYIKDLPSDFLSTPFGAALRPTIDEMYRRPGPGPIPTTQLPTPAATPTPANPNPQLTASILQAVAAQAQSQTPPSGNPATESLASPLHTVTNSASFAHLLKTHKAVVANFSNIQTCPPCRAIAPIYEQLARDKGGPRGAAFTKIDLSTSSGQSLGQEWKVRVMPTFMFFLDGNKISEMKGANENELRSEIDLLLFQAYPPHPHTSLSLPAIQSLSLTPILFTQVPALDAVLTKLSTFIDPATWPAGTQSQAEVKQVLSTSFIPFLKSRFGVPTPTTPTPNIQILSTWTKTTSTLIQTLPIESLFPLVDLWRLGVLDAGVSSFVSSTTTSTSNPILGFLSKPSSASTSELPKPYLLTLLRLLSNTFSNPLLGVQLLATTSTAASSTGGARALLTAILVPTLLHSDVNVRTAAASLVFNVAAVVQKGRVAGLNGTGGGLNATPNGGVGGIEDEDWEMEMISAVVEAIDREGGNEDVVHRLTASLAFLIRLSPSYQTQLAPLLEVLQAKAVLKTKVQAQGVVKKKDVKRLVEEVADKLCP